MASERRAATLVRKHLAAWLGDLKPHVVKASVTFARGFPDSARVAIRSDEALAAARQLDEWFSFTTLEFKERSFFTQSMRSLRKATGVDAQGLADLLTITLPLERLAATIDTRTLERVLPGVLARLPRLELLRLATGRIDDADVTSLIGRLPPSLATLTLDDVLVTPDRGLRLLAAAPAGLQRVVLGTATFTRTRQGWSGQGFAFG